MLLAPQLKADPCPQTKKLETMGLSREQAENLAVYLSEQIVLDRMRLSEKFTAKVELEKVSSSVHDGRGYVSLIPSYFQTTH
jgi:hypothetical protein